MLGAVRDLRKLCKEEREALKRVAARRAAEGQGPQEICQALELRPRTLAAWVKRGELEASVHSQTLALDQPDQLKIDQIDNGMTAQAVLARVRRAIQNGDRKGADQIVAGWASQRRRQKALITLEAEAARERQLAEAESALSDAQLAAEVSDLIGRRVRPITTVCGKS